MAASLTISSASVASDGRTVTVNIAGNSGALTPTSGVTGFRVRTTNTHTQTSATISGTALTIVLASFIGSAETVTIDTIAGNLADGSANTMVLSNGQACTNGSTKTTSYFAATNAAFYLAGNPSLATNFTRNGWSTSEPRQIDFLFTGTDCSLCTYAFSNQTLLVTIDGGAETSVSIVSIGVVTPTTWSEVPIASGLTQGVHRVRIINAFNNGAGNNYIDRDNAIKVAGSSPSITAPTSGNTAIDPRGTANPIKQSGGVTVVDNTAAIRPDDGYVQSNSTFWAPNSNVGQAFDIDFKATCGTIKVLARRGGSFILAVDGVPYVTSAASPSSDLAFAWMTVATGLDTTAEHVYRLTSTNVSGGIWGIETLGGTGINLAATFPTMKTIGFYGDSITLGFGNTDVAHCHTHMLAVRTGYNIRNCGVGGAHVVGDMNNAGRLASITSAAHLDRAVILGGTNDVFDYYNSGGTPNATYSAANFGTSYLAMLNSLTANGTTNTKLDCWGILIPGWGAAQDALTPSYNAQIQSAVAAMQAAYPAKASNYRYIDTTSFYPAGSPGAPHPGDSQSIIIANAAIPYLLPGLASWATGNAYAITGPSSGTVGRASTAFTVALQDGGRFNGVEQIALSDGGQGGTFTPSVGSPGTGTVTVTPANNATSFTFTYTPASTGSKTLTATNPQTWSNPSAPGFLSLAATIATMFFAA